MNPKLIGNIITGVIVAGVLATAGAATIPASAQIRPLTVAADVTSVGPGEQSPAAIEGALITDAAAVVNLRAAAAASAAALASEQEAIIAPKPAPAPTGWAEGQAPSGTPVPTHTETDSNSAEFGKQVPADPSLFCASRRASGPGDHATCD